MNLFKFLRLLQRGDLVMFEVPVEIQKSFLLTLADPVNDIDRSYKQYLCQDYFVRPRFKSLSFDIISLIAIPFVIGCLLLKGAFVSFEQKEQALIERKKMPEVIPESLRCSYSMKEFGNEIGMSLNFCDIIFIYSILKRGWRHPFFILKSIIKVSVYSTIIKKFIPDVIMQFGEYSFASSILTAFCNRKGVKHFNIMHGEKLFYIRDSFFRYDRCYVWDNHYVELFKSLRAYEDQFVVELPPSMKIDIVNVSSDRSHTDYKYYLALFDDTELKSIIRSLSILKSKGYTVKLRPHPRYSDIHLLKQYVSEDEIEDYASISILESISSTSNVIGLYTTVLTQAFFFGKRCILDDITYKTQYDRLKSYDYILAYHDLPTLQDEILR